MADFFDEIPDRETFKPSEVCEIAKIQPYVLKSWEQEFQSLGTQRSSGGVRVYRRGDVERVLRIKQLVFGEGLTLAGARRRLEGDTPRPPEPPAPMLDDAARGTLAGIKDELRALLDLLEKPPAAPDAERQATLPEMDGDGEATWPPKGKTVATRHGSRKRTAKAG